MPDFRDLCARMANELDNYRQLLLDDRSVTHRLADEARAALAQPEPPLASGEVDLAQRARAIVAQWDKHPVSPLSPAAQAILDAFRTSHTGQGCLAAALRAAAEQMSYAVADEAATWLTEIAAELDGTQSTSETTNHHD